MGCSVDSLAWHADQLKRLINLAATPAQLDDQLDRLAADLLLATEWDADRWGLDPDAFCKRERRIMETRIMAAGGEHHWLKRNRASR
jgi:chaperone required for assembly of F1-ATPase